jgi:sugar lactone lactonase YvrE
MTAAVHPHWAVPGGRVLLTLDLTMPADGPPPVAVGEHDAHVVAASPHHLRLVIPSGLEGGSMPIRIGASDEPTATVEVGRTLTTGLHQVDSPAYDGVGRLYATQSGGPGTKVPAPIYRVTGDGAREPVAVEIANPTSLALGPDGAMYVSSRFEGTVYRLFSDDRIEVFASELGVPTGLAFAGDGSLFVGDRSGSVFRISPNREVETFATLPPSVAAFHLAFGPDSCLYITAPTLSSRDVVYRVTPDRLVDVVYEGFGRPQGLAFDARGRLYIAEAAAGAAGLYRLTLNGADGPATSELVAAVPSLVGVAFDPAGGVVLASNDTIWRLGVDARPYWPGRTS